MTKENYLYNGLIDTTARLFPILNICNENKIELNIEQIRLLDIYTVFSKEIKGPINVLEREQGFPISYKFREKVINPAIIFIKEIHKNINENNKNLFLKNKDILYTNEYLNQLKQNSIFLFKKIKNNKINIFDKLKNNIENEILKYNFNRPENQLENFLMLDRFYSSDIKRIKGMLNFISFIENTYKENEIIDKDFIKNSIYEIEKEIDNINLKQKDLKNLIKDLKT